MSSLCLLCGRYTKVNGKAAPVGDCDTIGRVVNIFPTTFVLFTGLLLFIRVFAIYNRNYYIGIAFATPWLGAVAMTASYYKTMGATNIGPTPYCLETLNDSHHLLVATYVLLFVDEALVYLAVVWRIYLMFLDHARTSLSQKFRVLVRGATLPILSRIILLDSQMYFL